jgi:hypothetical protein
MGDDAEAKLEIHEVLYQYCRSMDRMDAALALDCFEPDGELEYSGLYRGSPAGFVEWLWPVHGAMVAHSHMVTNIIVDVTNGDTAVSEAYVLVTLRIENKGELVDLIGKGRYLDRWRRFEGRWRIAHRTYVSDLGTVHPVGTRNFGDLFRTGSPGQQRVIAATRDTNDPSYALLPPIRGA